MKFGCLDSLYGVHSQCVIAGVNSGVNGVCVATRWLGESPRVGWHPTLGFLANRTSNLFGCVSFQL